MALYPDTSSMLNESLNELLVAAKYGLEYSKKKPKWPADQEGGCLGYPTGLLLSCIVDTIGAFHRNRPEVQVKIGGNKRPIRKDDEHFYILNSDYFGLTLDDKTIETLYRSFRSTLVHNSLIRYNVRMIKTAETDSEVFTWSESLLIVDLTRFLEISESAVARFLKNVPQVLANSGLSEHITSGSATNGFGNVTHTPSFESGPSSVSKVVFRKKPKDGD